MDNDPQYTDLTGSTEPPHNQSESQPDAPAETPLQMPAVVPPPVPPAGSGYRYAPPPPNQPAQWPSILQLTFSLLAFLGLFSLGLFQIAAGLIGILGGEAPLEDTTTFFLAAAAMIFASALVLPSAFFALARLRNWQLAEPAWLKALMWPFRNAWSLLLIAPIVVGLGYLVTNYTRLSWLLLPPIHLAAAGIPVLFLVYLATLGKNLGSPQRRWGAMAAGFILGPLIAIILEIMALIAGVIAFMVYVIANPALTAEIEALVMKLSIAGTSEQLMLQALSPYLVKPAVIASILFGMAVVVPLIEEAVKPVAVWLLAGKNLTPSQGFALGAISGAGFALYENLAISITGEMWAAVIVARVGTAVLHILTTSLTGWALAASWRDRRYLRLLPVYLLAVGIHGLWNGIAVAAGIRQFDVQGPLQDGWVGQVITASPAALVIIVVLMFGLLLALSLRLRSANHPAPRSEDEFPASVD